MAVRVCAGHAVGDAAGGGVFETGGVDQAQRQAVEHRVHRLAVAGHARRVMHDGERAPGQPVKEAGFADIGPSDNGEREAA